MTIEEALQTAIARHRAGQLDAASAIYRQILVLQPDHADALHLLGAVALTLGQLEPARDLIARAMALSPEEPAYHSNLGETYRRLGRLDEAIVHLRKAVALQPDYADAWNNLGSTLAQKEQWEESIASLQRAITLRPDDISTLNNLALALMKLGRAADALQHYGRALALDPLSAEAHDNLGHALLQSGRWDNAIMHCRRAVELRPDFVEAHGRLAVALLRQGRHEEAIACHEQALSLQPGSAELRGNLAVAHLECGHYEKALEACEQALESDPDFAPSHWLRSLLLLHLGRFEEGWREHEWRWKAPPLAAYRRPFPVPQWDGTPIPGQTILAHAEQGYGDAIQFLRYVLLLQNRADIGGLILECGRPLVRLIAASVSPGVDVFPRETWDGHELPFFDRHIPWHSLPLALASFKPVPMTKPYLRTDPELRALWCARIGSDARLRVGLVWTGNPDFQWDHSRSIPPEKYLPLLQLPGIRFYSLQVQTRHGTPPALVEAGLVDWTGQITDFSDTAALVAELDLVISTDGVTVHLAGALGKPAWVLLPFVADWRWHLGREETPWYPTVRLFRQPAIGDWDSVLRQVGHALAETTVASLRAPPAPANKIE